LDSTVTETDIHYPTDSSLLDDAARVLSRCVKRARTLCAPRSAAAKAWFRDRHRAAHRLAFQINRLSRPGAKKPANAGKTAYRRLIQLVAQLLEQVHQVQKALASVTCLRAEVLLATLRHYVPLVEQVIAQTRRRVLSGQTVPAAEKVVSLFEPHTAIICRGKAQPKETEFGRKIWFAEVEGGLVSGASWQAIRRIIHRSSRACISIGDCSSARRRSLVVIAGFTRRPMNSRPGPWGSSASACPNRGTRQPSAAGTKSSVGSAPPNAFGRALKDGLANCDERAACTAVLIMV
jgi:hypothetical protein